MNSEIYRAVQDIPALNRGDAAELADRIIDGLIGELRRNPALPARSHDDWSLLLAEQRVRTADQIAELVNGCVGLDEVLNTIEAAW
jgi:hypothetical protein